MSQEAFQETFSAFKQQTRKPDILSFFNSGGASGVSRTGSDSTINIQQEQSESLLGSFASSATGAISSTLGLSSDPSKARDAECFGLTTFQRYLGFGMMMSASALFFFLSLLTLPMVVLAPGKFASSYTFGSLLFLTSFTVLNGWRAHAKHLFCWERAPFTITYLGSMMFCLYFSVISSSYIAVIFFTIVQMLSLAWYLASYFPGGTGVMTRMARSALPV